MKDLTQGPIGRLLVAMAVPIAIGMLFQTLYFLVDLYFVSRLGDAAIAGVSTAGTVSFVILALTQMLGVGTVALVSHAAGRKDQAQANLVFNQSLSMSVAIGLITMTVLYIVIRPYLRSIAADDATIEAMAQIGLVSATYSSMNQTRAEAMKTLTANRIPSGPGCGKLGPMVYDLPRSDPA